jgi:hypothetical protein
MAYRIYVADALRIVSENTAKFSGGGFVNYRLTDILFPKKENRKTAEEIIADITKRAGIEVLTNEPV